MKGCGEDGLNGGDPGTLYILIDILPDKIFKRNGKNLETNCYINPIVGIVGGEVEVPTLHGMKKIEINENTKNGTTFLMEKE